MNCSKKAFCLVKEMLVCQIQDILYEAETLPCSSSTLKSPVGLKGEKAKIEQVAKCWSILLKSKTTAFYHQLRRKKPQITLNY